MVFPVTPTLSELQLVRHNWSDLNVDKVCMSVLKKKKKNAQLRLL